MSIEKMVNIGGIQPATGSRSGISPAIPEAGASFKDALESLKSTKSISQDLAVDNIEPLKFSNHAISRMQNRGVRFDPAEIQKIESAVLKAKAKGAKETLVLSDKAAMIVSVKNNTVVTVLDKTSMKDNVFTNIDSTVVI